MRLTDVKVEVAEGIKVSSKQCHEGMIPFNDMHGEDKRLFQEKQLRGIQSTSFHQGIK